MRAFTPWPGTKQRFILHEKGTSRDDGTKLNLKVLKTAVGKSEDWKGKESTDITVTKDALHVRCTDGSVLSILQLQMSGKKPVSALSFANGMLQSSSVSRTDMADAESEQLEKSGSQRQASKLKIESLHSNLSDV